MNNKCLLEMDSICKSFNGVSVLKNVNFSVNCGEVHALMGENGAGKSTLMKILTGVYSKDSGNVVFDAQEINPRNPLEAQKIGISTIYQELNLIPQQTVYENIYIGREPIKNGCVDRKNMKISAQNVLKDFGIDIDVNKPLQHFNTAIQQMIAVSRAVTTNARLFVMDEPTSSLDVKETQMLFKVIKQLVKKGNSVIFISHKMDEIFDICDRVTILRDGKHINTCNVADITKLELINMMVGNAKKYAENGRLIHNKKDTKIICETVKVSYEKRINNVDLNIKKGEVVGLAGLLGSGRSELAKIIFGEYRPSSGRILLFNNEVTLNHPKNAIKLGLGFCSEDRKVEGIVPNLTVKENMTLAVLPKICKMGIISPKKENEIYKYYSEKLKLKTTGPNQLIRYLSGGNQQKVLLARWLCMNPKLVILDEPTRGIDVGAKVEIEELIRGFAENGVSVLLISSEIEELERNCDRVVVLNEGKVVSELVSDEVSQSRITEAIASTEKAE